MNDDELFLDELDFDDEEDPFVDVDAAQPAVRTLEEFEAEVDRNIKLLLAVKNGAEKRRAAAEWLGESGSPRAISALVKVYEKDKKNKSVQAAAAYALGQFKALDEAIIRDEDEPVIVALGREENEPIVSLLEDIALRDQRGKPARFSNGALLGLALVLLLTFGGLMMANLNIDDTPPAITPTPTAIAAFPRTEAQIAGDTLTEAITQLKADVQILQMQVATSEGESELNCDLVFTSPDAVTVADDGAFPALNAHAAQYGALYADFVAAKAPFDAACTAADGATELDHEGINADLATVLADLAQLEADVATTRAAIDADAVQAFELELKQTQDAAQLEAEANVNPEGEGASTEEVLTVEEEAPTPTAGLSAVELRSHAGQLYDLIDQATIQRGFVAVLAQYWGEVRDNGQTGGCIIPQPTIPADYALSEEDAQLVPELASAVTQVNVGLQLARTGWSFFSTACENLTLTQNIELGLSTINTANSAFTEARRILDELTGRNP